MYLRPLLLVLAVAWAPLLADAQTVKIKRDHFLLLDDSIIESSSGVELVVAGAAKHKDNPLMVEDKAWEPRYGDLLANVIFDPYEKFYKAWYNPFIVCESTEKTPEDKRGELKYLGSHAGSKRETGVLYGTSHDGLFWNKPLLGQNPVGGEKSNILVRGPRGAGVLRDLYERDASRLFKMLFKGEEHLSTAFSPDGITWSAAVPHPQINAAGDTMNTVLFAPTLNRYVAFTSVVVKSGGKEIRTIGRTLTKDFKDWSKAETVLQGEKDSLQIYAMPVIFHGGVYIGFPVIHNTKTDRYHTELAWSPDTVSWKRLSPGSPILTNAPKAGAYDWGAAFATAVIPRRDGVRIYYTGSDGPRSGWRKGSLNLATLKPDGLAGWRAGAGKTGTVVTGLVDYGGGELSVAAEVSKGGSLKTEVFDSAGKLIGQWKEGAEIALPTGGKVSLKFTLAGATIYGFRFGDVRFP